MIKQLHEVKLRDIIMLDATKSARSLMKYPLPAWMFRKQLENLAKQVFDLIGGQSVDELQKEFDKIIAYRKLQILEALYKAVSIELGLKAQINVFKLLLEKDYKPSEQLEKVLEEVKKHTGIEIKEPKDVKDLEGYIQFKIDKYTEMYTGEEERETVSLSKIIYSVFNFLQEPYNENMRLITFVEMKQIAEDRMRKNTNTGSDGSNE